MVSLEIGRYLRFRAKAGSVCLQRLSSRAFIQGLSMEMRLDRVVLENDYLEAISLIKHGCPLYHPCLHIVKKITELLALDWWVELWLVYREHNQVADALARSALMSFYVDCFSPVVPDICVPLVVADLENSYIM